MRSQRAEAGAAGFPPAETLDELATLRLAIVQEYPCLYRGRRDDELKYLHHYAATTDVCIILDADGGRMIGAPTPMAAGQALPVRNS